MQQAMAGEAGRKQTDRFWIGSRAIQQLKHSIPVPKFSSKPQLNPVATLVETKTIHFKTINQLYAASALWFAAITSRHFEPTSLSRETTHSKFIFRDSESQRDVENVYQNTQIIETLNRTTGRTLVAPARVDEGEE